MEQKYIIIGWRWCVNRSDWAEERTDKHFTAEVAEEKQARKSAPLKCFIRKTRNLKN
jgi:hypothetical protein